MRSWPRYDLLLQQEGSLLSSLKLRFQLNDEYIEALKDEIIEVKQQAIDRDGRVLVWIGDPSTAPAPGAAASGSARRRRLHQAATNGSSHLTGASANCSGKPNSPGCLPYGRRGAHLRLNAASSR